MGSKRRGKVKKVLGQTPEGLPDIPQKISNVKLARIVHSKEHGCSRCFPHGIETDNSTARKHRRSWKYYRQTKYRPTKAEVRAAPDRGT
jgi:hypothetical protein